MSYGAFPDLPVTGSLDYALTTWGGTAGGFIGTIPQAVGGTFANQHRLVLQDARIVGILFKCGTGTVPSDRTLTVQVNGSDTSLVMNLVTGDSVRTVFTPQIDVSVLDQVAVRHATGSASGTTNDARVLLLLQRRSM